MKSIQMLSFVIQEYFIWLQGTSYFDRQKKSIGVFLFNYFCHSLKYLIYWKMFFHDGSKNMTLQLLSCFLEMVTIRSFFQDGHVLVKVAKG
jgi:hypothetical protein